MTARAIKILQLFLIYDYLCIISAREYGHKIRRLYEANKLYRRILDRRVQARGKTVVDAVRGETVCAVTSDGIDMATAVQFARDVGGSKLRAMTFHERAAALKATAKHLMEKKEQFYDISLKQEPLERMLGLILKAVLGRCLVMPG